MQGSTIYNVQTDFSQLPLTREMMSMMLCQPVPQQLTPSPHPTQHINIGANHPCLANPHTQMTMDTQEDQKLGAIFKHRMGTSVEQPAQQQHK